MSKFVYYLCGIEGEIINTCKANPWIKSYNDNITLIILTRILSYFT